MTAALPDPYYTDDHVTIYHGDALEIMTSLVYDVVVTDPPYGIGWSRGANPARSSAAHAGIVNDHNTDCRDAALHAAAHVPAVVFGSFYAPFPAGLKHVLVWEKPADAGVVGSTTGYRRDVEPVFLVGPWPFAKCHSGSVLRSHIPNIGSPSSPAGRHGHPHAKPEDLMRALIERCPPGVVLDPFAGSGSTLRAAKDLGRRAIGVEVVEAYAERAARRCAQEVLPLT